MGNFFFQLATLGFARQGPPANRVRVTGCRLFVDSWRLQTVWISTRMLGTAHFEALTGTKRVNRVNLS